MNKNICKVCGHPFGLNKSTKKSEERNRHKEAGCFLATRNDGVKARPELAEILNKERTS